MISLLNLPLAYKVLFSSFLILIGIGYLTALSLLYLVDVEPHRKLGQNLVTGISEVYHGAPRGTRLRAALVGPMADKISASEREKVLNWVGNGARPSRQKHACAAAIAALPPIPDFLRKSTLTG